MSPDDRKTLEALGVSAEVIERADEVLRFWGAERLFARCADCGGWCLDPDLPRRKNRKKLPADLFHRRPLLSVRTRDGEVRCIVCDDIRFGQPPAAVDECKPSAAEPPR